MNFDPSNLLLTLYLAVTSCENLDNPIFKQTLTDSNTKVFNHIIAVK